MKKEERYFAYGHENMSDVELLSIACDISETKVQELINSLGSIRDIIEMSPGCLAKQAKISEQKAVRVHAALVVGRRSRVRVGEVGEITCFESAKALFVPMLSNLGHEEMHAVYLDRRCRVLNYKILTRGSDAFTIVDPRQILRPAVALGAKSFILAHNHPSQDPFPSQQDIDVTKRIQYASDIIGVTLLDHLVVGGNLVTSLKERGYIHNSPVPNNWTG